MSGRDEEPPDLNEEKIPRMSEAHIAEPTRQAECLRSIPTQTQRTMSEVKSPLQFRRAPPRPPAAAPRTHPNSTPDLDLL
jgi:hypothetical protein